MAVKTRRGHAGNDYLDLVRRFPLRPLRSEKELDEAIRLIDSLLDQEELNDDAQDYLDVLRDLISQFVEPGRSSFPEKL